MRGLLLILAIGLACDCNAPVRAESFVTGNQLNDWCTAPPSSDTAVFDAISCLNYIVGAADGFFNSRDMRGKPACLPRGAVKGQVRDIVIQYLRDHPAIRTATASSIVTAALIAAFPTCRS